MPLTHSLAGPDQNQTCAPGSAGTATSPSEVRRPDSTPPEHVENRHEADARGLGGTAAESPVVHRLTLAAILRCSPDTIRRLEKRGLLTRVPGTKAPWITRQSASAFLNGRPLGRRSVSARP